MEIEASAGGVTVRVVGALNPPKLAVIVVVPWANVVARPAELIVATAPAVEVHVAVLVRSEWLPSE
jgi:hypothetical protein